MRSTGSRDPNENLYVFTPGDQAHLSRHKRQPRVDGDKSRSVLTEGKHNVENIRAAVPRMTTIFTEPTLCNRCYGRHAGFTCPTD